MQNIKYPLFQTHDGSSVCKDTPNRLIYRVKTDVNYHGNKSWTIDSININVLKLVFDIPAWLYGRGKYSRPDVLFGDIENAQQYIKMHKPVFCYKDILDILDKYELKKDILDEFDKLFFEKIINLVNEI